MPKSKRNKIVHLTKVKKKGKDHKEDLAKQLEQYMELYTRVFVFDFESTKSDRIMALRLKLKEFGRIFAGRHSVVNVTLDKLGKRNRIDFVELRQQVSGQRGLLFANIEVQQLVSLLSDELPEFCKKLLGYAQIKNFQAAKAPSKRAPTKSGKKTKLDSEAKAAKSTGAAKRKETRKKAKSSRRGDESGSESGAEAEAEDDADDASPDEENGDAGHKERHTVRFVGL